MTSYAYLLHAYQTEAQKLERLTYLYYLGIPVSFPYNDIIKEFDDFYNCHERINLVDTNNQNVICGLDKNKNFLFALKALDEDNNWVTMIYTERYEDMHLRIANLLNSTEPNVDTMRRYIIENIVVNRNKTNFHELMLLNSNSGYFNDLKKDYISKKSKHRNLALEGNSLNF